MELGSGSCSNSSSSNSSDSLNGLKFGGKIYFESANGPGGSSTATKPPPAPAKKGKVRVGTGGQPPLCQVEGCNLDLSDAKAYYSRHKVCVMHSMSPKVIVAGIEQRFCQQCSRFHMLPQFDQGKRSCRKRLANHNERRRKPSPGSLFSNLHGSLSSPFLESSGKAGSFVLDFSKCPDLTGRDSWPQNPPNMLWHCSSKASSSYSDAPSGECVTGVSDCSRALSLLSTQPSGSGERSSSSLEMNGFVDARGVQSSGSNRDDIDGYSSTLWGGYKVNECNDSSLEVLLPDLGLGRISQPDSSRYYEDLETAAQHNEGDHLVVENPRGCDSSEQNMHWFS